MSVCLRVPFLHSAMLSTCISMLGSVSAILLGSTSRAKGGPCPVVGPEMAAEQQTYFYIEQCPLPDFCSAKARRGTDRQRQTTGHTQSHCVAPFHAILHYFARCSFLQFLAPGRGAAAPPKLFAPGGAVTLALATRPRHCSAEVVTLGTAIDPRPSAVRNNPE